MLWFYNTIDHIIEHWLPNNKIKTIKNKIITSSQLIQMAMTMYEPYTTYNNSMNQYTSTS